EFLIGSNHTIRRTEKSLAIRVVPRPLDHGTDGRLSLSAARARSFGRGRRLSGGGSDSRIHSILPLVQLSFASSVCDVITYHSRSRYEVGLGRSHARTTAPSRGEKAGSGRCREGGGGPMRSAG